MDDLERELAEIEREGGSGEAGTRGRRGLGLLPLLVAVLGVSGVGAVVYYAYNSGVREGSEVAAPLLTPDGPIKVKPDDPGGLVVPHRDKSVFAVVQQGGAPVDEEVETLLPPPEDPMRPPAPQLAATDSGSSPTPSDAEASSGADGGAAPPIPSITESPPEQPVASPEPAPAPTTPRPPTPMEPVLPAAGLQAPSAPPTLEAAAPAEGATEAEPEGGAERAAAPTPTPTPTPAPAAETTPSVISPPPENAPENAQVAGVDLSSAWRIQIGALRSQEAAEREWARQSDRHKDLLGALSLQVQRVTIDGKGEFFRVRGGPLPNKATADDLCAQLAAKKLSCLSIRPGA